MALPKTLGLLLALAALNAPLAAARAAHGGSEQVVAVEVPVQVLRDGEPVRGLTADDFVLRDRGTAQPLTGFEEVDLDHPAAAGPRAEPPPFAARRRFLLLFDLSYSRPAAIRRAQAVARDLIRNRLRPSDLVAVGTYTVERGARIILSFTSDHEQAEVAVDTFGLAGLVESKDDPLGFILGSFGDNPHDRELAESLEAFSRSTTQGDRALRRDLVLAYGRAMGQLADVLREVPGQKRIILLSEGFDASLLVGTENRRAVTGTAQNVEHGRYWAVDSQTRYGDSDALKEIQDRLGTLRKAGVTIEAADIGRGAVEPGGEGRSTASDGLFLLASATGGRVYGVAADDASGLEPLLERTAVTYLLTFQPAELGKPGSYHSLDVELAEGVAEAQVVARPGYYAPIPYDRLSEQARRVQASNLLMSGASGGPLTLETLAVPIREASGPPYVAVLVEIDGPPLLATARDKAVKLELFGYAFDLEGRVQDRFVERWAFDLDQVGETLRDTGVKYFGHLDLPPGDYRLHLLARDGAGREGLRRVAVHVPDFASDEPVLLPPLVPEPPGRWVTVRENSERQKDRQVAYPFLWQGAPYLPAAALRLPPSGGSTPVILATYGLGGARPKVTARVFDPAGTEEVTKPVALGGGRGEAGGEGRTDFRGTLRAGRLERGGYELSVSLDGAGGQRTPTVSLPVRVAPRAADEMRSATAVLAGSPVRGAVEPGATGDKPLVIVPPQAEPARGRVRFDTVVADPAVARVTFSLDGRPAATDRRPPFRATLDLGDPPAAHEVRASAYDLDGHLLGADSVALNRDLAPFRVAIRDVSGNPSQGAVEVSADVGVPAGDRLDRVEFYFDDQRVATVREAPFRARVPTARNGPTDYVQVVAYLAGGASREDVRLLGATTPGERVDVELVQLFALVTDDAGEPVEGLSKGDFELLRGGRPLTIDRVVPAGEIPLTLGLLLDSSQSMSGLLLDAKLASARFLRSVLQPRDRAFLVDFDERPRLAMDVTGDVGRLETALGSLEVGGRTALFDSLVFALGRLETERGRRAVVLLSDGLDDGSRFGPSRAVELASRQGIPIYVLSLAEPGGEGARVLERLARSTGGRVFPARSLDDVKAAYREIDRELRTQYVIVHTLASPLAPGAARQMTVEVRGKGRHVRTLPLPPGGD